MQKEIKLQEDNFEQFVRKRSKNDDDTINMVQVLRFIVVKMQNFKPTVDEKGDWLQFSMKEDEMTEQLNLR